MPFDVVGIGGGLIFVDGVLGDADFVFAGKVFERDPSFWEKKTGDIGQRDFPTGKVFFDVDDGGGEDHGITKVFAIF